MKHLMVLVERSWFAKAPAARLAVLRILLGGYVLYYLGRRYSMLLKVAASDPALFKPVGVACVLKKPLPVPVVRRILIATFIANLAYMSGWRYRYSGPAFASLLLWVLSYRNSWSMIYHNDNVLVLHALILGFAPAADALALDSSRRSAGTVQAFRRSVWPDRNPQGDWHYGWPVKLMNSVTVMTYFVSGIAKVTGPLGWRWADGESMRSQVAVDGVRKELLGSRATPLTFWLYDKVWLFRIMATGSLVMELMAPLALADRRLGRAWVASAFAMHWGILLVMGITFRYQLTGLIFASFFDVERAAYWLPREWTHLPQTLPPRAV